MTEQSRSGKRKQLLEDPDVRRWYENLRRSSLHTANNHLGNLGYGLEVVGHTPKSAIRLSRSARDDLLMDMVAKLEAPREDGTALAPGSVYARQAAVISWLKWNGCPPSRKVKITNQGWKPVAEQMQILNQQQTGRFYQVAGARTRVAGAFINFCGVRPEALGWIDGSKGLLLKHLPELRLSDDAIEIDKVPMRIDVPRELNKGPRSYTTFLGAQGIGYLLTYLESRRNQGETLTPESPVITDYSNSGRIITTKSISKMIRRAFRKIGIKEPPYILKSVWMNRAIKAEADGFTSTYRTYCVGHTGSIGGHVTGLALDYGLRKQIDSETLEQIRAAYAILLRHLETEAVATVEDPVRQFWAMVLEDLGDGDASVDSLRGKSEEEIRELVAQKFQEARAAASAPTRQEVIPLASVSDRLGTGWRFVANLGDGTAIVEGT